MGILLIDRRLVRTLLPMEECVDLMAETLAAVARDESVNPLRSAMFLPNGDGLLGTMPSYLANIDVMGIKVVSVFQADRAASLDSHQGAVMLFDPHHGRPLAIVDAGEITAIRTAAVSAVATRVLARSDAKRLAILGSGEQATSHLHAMLAVRPIEKVTVWSRTADHASEFAGRAAETGVSTSVATDADSAVSEADIVCTVTSAREPILRGESLRAGAHVNAVGSCTPITRELDSEAVRNAVVFVDSRESALAEAGDLLVPLGEGSIGEEHIRGELGDLVRGRCQGRGSKEEITLFESLGLAVEDLAAANLVFNKAREEGLGVEFDLAGRGDGAH